MTSQDGQDITGMLAAWNVGDADARDRLIAQRRRSRLDFTG
jgi:hypothetical protein